MGDGICAYFGVPTAREDDPERAATGGAADPGGRQRLRARRRARLGHRAVRRARRRSTPGPPRWASWGRRSTSRRWRSATRPTSPRACSRSRRPGRSWSARRPRAGLRTASCSTRSASCPFAAGRGRSRSCGWSGPCGPTTRRGARLRSSGARPRWTGCGRRRRSSRQGADRCCSSPATRASARPACSASSGRSSRRSVTWLEGHCLSYGGLPIWPFEEMLRRWLGVADEEPEIATRTKARARLGALLGPGLDEALAPLGRLLRVRLDPDVAAEAGRDESPEAVRRAFCAWIEALARSRPVVVAVEDLHWALPEARELAESLLELTDRAAVLLVATLRLDSGSEAWRFRLRALGDFAHRTVELRLGPLSTADAAAARARPRGRGPRRADDRGGRVTGRGEPAVPRGARTAPARGVEPRAATHVDADGRPGPAAGPAREPPRRPDRRAAGGGAPPRAGRRGDRALVRGAPARARRGHGRRRGGVARRSSGRRSCTSSAAIRTSSASSGTVSCTRRPSRRSRPAATGSSQARWARRSRSCWAPGRWTRPS